MGFSKKHQMDGEKEGKKWVIAGIVVRAPLRSISTKKPKEGCEEEDGEGSTTPTARESRIPEKLPCPPPPRKRRPKSTCQSNVVREFFTPPDLESVFMCKFENAN